MDTSKRSPEEILAALEEADLSDEADRVAGLSDGEVDRELALAGVDPAAVRTKGREGFERAMKGRVDGLAKPAAEQASGTSRERGPRARPLALPPHRARPPGRLHAAWIAAAAVAATTGLVAIATAPAVVAWWRPGHDTNVDGTPHPPRTPAQERARSLRDTAATACAKGLFAECAAGLDEARRLDPAGEDEGRVKELRQAIEGAGGSGNKGG
jgi:hypothetical protein